MRRLLLTLSLLTFTSLLSWGQGGNTVIIRFAGAPTGSCSVVAVAVNNATGEYFDCLSGSWHSVGGTGGSGTVTSVSFTGGLISVATPTTTPAFTVAGTSGGIPYFSAASTWASSGALTANLPVIGGGAGVAPGVGSVTGNTTQFATWTGATTASRCVHTDASGNLIIAAADCASAGATTALDNLAAVAINTALLAGTDNSIALGSSSKRWSNLFATAINCGVGGTTGCVITGNGATSGTATITWPAVAGTTANAIVFSNNISAPQFVAGGPGTGALQFTNSNNAISDTSSFYMRFISNGNSLAAVDPNGAFLATTSLGFNNTNSLSARDTSLSWLAAGSLGIGNGTAGNTTGSLTLAKTLSSTNCSNAASPAVCAAAAAGVVAVPTGTNPTLTINTTAVTANSQIFLQIDESSTIAATTCNTTLSTLVQPVVTARVAATSFTIQIGAVIASNPACVSYYIVN